MLVSVTTLPATLNLLPSTLTFFFSSLLSFLSVQIFFFSRNLCHFFSPSFCGVAVSSSPPSLSAEQRYPFFFRMLQMRIPNRPITQKIGTKANTAYSAVFSSALRTTVPLTGPPAPLDGPLPTVRTVLRCKDAERKQKKERAGCESRNMLLSPRPKNDCELHDGQAAREKHNFETHVAGSRLLLLQGLWVETSPVAVE